MKELSLPKEPSVRNETFWQTLKHVHFKLPCFLFEQQTPNWIWNNNVLGWWAYKLHDFLCPEMWLVWLRVW